MLKSWEALQGSVLPQETQGGALIEQPKYGDIEEVADTYLRYYQDHDQEMAELLKLNQHKEEFNKHYQKLQDLCKEKEYDINGINNLFKERGFLTIDNIKSLIDFGPAGSILFLMFFEMAGNCAMIRTKEDCAQVAEIQRAYQDMQRPEKKVELIKELLSNKDYLALQEGASVVDSIRGNTSNQNSVFGQYTCYGDKDALLLITKDKFTVINDSVTDDGKTVILNVKEKNSTHALDLISTHISSDDLMKKPDDGLAGVLKAWNEKQDGKLSIVNSDNISKNDLNEFNKKKAYLSSNMVEQKGNMVWDQNNRVTSFHKRTGWSFCQGHEIKSRSFNHIWFLIPSTVPTKSLQFTTHPGLIKNRRPVPRQDDPFIHTAAVVAGTFSFGSQIII